MESHKMGCCGGVFLGFNILALVLVCAAHGTQWYSKEVNIEIIKQTLTGDLDSFTWTLSLPLFPEAGTSCTFPTNPSSPTPPCEKDVLAALGIIVLSKILDGAFDGFLHAFGGGAWTATVALKASIALLSANIILWFVMLMVCMRVIKSWSDSSYDTLFSMTSTALVLCSLAAYGATVGAWVAYIVAIPLASSFLGGDLIPGDFGLFWPVSPMGINTGVYLAAVASPCIFIASIAMCCVACSCCCCHPRRLPKPAPAFALQPAIALTTFSAASPGARAPGSAGASAVLEDKAVVEEWQQRLRESQEARVVANPLAFSSAPRAPSAYDAWTAALPPSTPASAVGGARFCPQCRTRTEAMFKFCQGCGCALG